MIPSLANRIGRAVARCYRLGAGLERADVAAFIASALDDAWRRRRWLAVPRLAADLAADIARSWIGRSAVSISARPYVPSHSDSRRSSNMDRLFSDVRYAVRVLARAPLFTTIGIVTLAVGIGAATAVYAVVDGVLLRPFTYPHMDRLVLLNERGMNGQAMSVAWPTFLDWRAGNDVFEELGVYRGTTVTLTGGETPERVPGGFVSASVFTSMGIPPISGRVLGEAEDTPGTARVAVISERLWRGRFEARADIVGQAVVLNSEPFTIVGVMPSGMRFPSRTTDVWLPIGLLVDTFPKSRGAHPGLFAVGRIKPGLTFERAQLGMDAVAKRLAEQYPDTNSQLTVQMASYYEQIVQNIRPMLYLLFGAVTLLVLMACTNLASLMLARAEGRHREMAVRAALGARRGRLIRQVLIEAALVAAVGGAMGLALAQVGVRAFVAMQPATVPRIDLLAVDWRVASFAVALSAMTALAMGVLPALRAAAPDLHSHLRDGRSIGSRRAVLVRRVLVVGQVAVASVLLVGAGLLARSFARLSAIELGFQPSHVLTMRLAIPDAAYPTQEAWINFHREIVDRMAALPGAEAAGLNSALPLQGGGSESPVIKEGDPLPTSGRVDTMCLFQTSGGDYFRAMGIELKRGRLFDARDGSGSAPVVIVDETLAQKMFAGENPIGRRIAFEFQGQGPQASARWREVVGVVSTVKHYGLTGGPPYVQVYTPFTQIPIWFQNRRPAMALVVRAAGDPGALIGSVRRAVAAVDPGVPVFGVQPMAGYLGQQVEQPRLSALIMTGFGGLAILVATVGLYGVLAYLVSQRTREIGVRLALGARRVAIVRQIVRAGLTLAIAGLVIGLGISLAAAGWMATLLYEVSPTDAATLAGVAGVLLLIAFVASLLPARRAARVDPLVALRAD